jgi:hypothetical protein
MSSDVEHLLDKAFIDMVGIVDVCDVAIVPK